MNQPSTPAERWRSTAESLSWVNGSLDHSTFDCFKAAVSEGIAKADAIGFAEAKIRAAGARAPRGKFDRQWLGAIKWVARHGSLSKGNEELPTEHGVDLARIDSLVRAGPGFYDIWEQSPVRFEDGVPHTEEIIDVIFPGDPWLCVGKGKYLKATRRRETVRGRLANGEFIVAQTMTSQFGVTAEGRKSEHTLANTGPWRNYVVEFDFSEKDKAGNDTKWALLVRGWAALGTSVADACAALIDHLAGFAPLGLLLHSAGKSCHGWFPIAGATPAQLGAFKAEALTLGADPALFRNRSQFVRIPDGARSSGLSDPKVCRQITYYFNPEVFLHGT